MLILVPSLRTTDATTGSVVMHVILYLFVVAPFLFLGALLRFTHAARRILLLSIPYLACHAILAGSMVIDNPRPQEFGYLGLFLVPFYESIVALPAGVALILVTEAFARRQVE